jgi:choline dehydrogenase-like flavoprotein
LGIAVGGGSAGSVVAARLSKSFKVLLIEAGGDPHGLTYIPSVAEPLLTQPMINWRFETKSLNMSGYAWKDQVIIK